MSTPRKATEATSLVKLSDAHREIDAMLIRMRFIADALADQSIDAETRRAAAEVSAFFTGHARQHHADEEARIFPGLLALGDNELTAHVRRLQQDHGFIEENWIELEPQLEALAHDRSGYDIDELRHATEVFVDLCREHIEVEDSIVYPAARSREDAAAQGRQSRAGG